MKSQHPDAAFCGDYCGKCPNYPHTCAGCIPADHMNCAFVQCCLRQDIAHCGLCDDFPCQSLVNFVPDDRPGCPPGFHIENLRLRMQMGTGAWLHHAESAAREKGLLKKHR